MSPIDGRRGVSAAAVRAQAAAWIARLHGPNRTREVEEGLRRWMTQDPEHAAAFELLTDVWEKAGHLKRRRIESASTAIRAQPWLSSLRTALATVLLAAMAVGAQPHPHSFVVTTGIGELRQIRLADGTRIELDADTRLRVQYGVHRRQVVLAKGQAYFEVAHRDSWPFLVTAGGHAIRDVGTQFNVRRDGDLLAVTLVEGKVTVSGVRPLELAPGETVTYTGTGAPKVHRPAVARMLAWERGEVPLANISLAAAATELNRYSRERIVVDPAVAALRVSGIVQAGDSSSFAAAVAQTYGLRLLQPTPQLIVLAPRH